MKKTITAILLMVLCFTVFSSLCEEAATFSFRNGVMFGMSEEEIKKIEADYNQVDLESWESTEISAWQVLLANTKVSSYDSNLMYFFTNDQMEAAFYDFSSFDEDNPFNAIAAALSEEYGEKESIEPKEIIKLMDYFSPGFYSESDIKSPYVWYQDGVNVYQFYYDNNDDVSDDNFAICYFNPAWDYSVTAIENSVE